MEQWSSIEEFPVYLVSDLGRVRNNLTGRDMAKTMNQQGNVMVGLSFDGEQYSRSVALLVANAFIPKPYPIFNTPIHLDGDRTNNAVENLMWRPRWFAIMYQKQFTGHRYRSTIVDPVVQDMSGEVSENTWECAKRYGLLERDLVRGIQRRTPVWPIRMTFSIQK